MCQSPSLRGTHFYHIGKILKEIGWLCQSPSLRGTHFYMGARSVRLKNRTVSIPFTSGNSFLPVLHAVVQVPFRCVNPLHLGELISTWSASQVSCRGSSVNPPHLGELISTNFSRYTYSHAEYCVNPLHLGELISTGTTLKAGDLNKVSIPFTSGNSFLPGEKNRITL